MSTKPTIWCLFSVENNYDQPDNNLVRWWSQRPSIEALASVLGYKLAQADDNTVVAIVDVWKGKGTIVRPGETRYRLQEVAEGDSP